MAFTAPVITHSFENADGTSGSGNVKFSLLGRMTNSGKTIVPASITSNLDGSGNISQAVTSNLDPLTTPQTTEWRADLNILGASEESFTISVPPIQTETNGSIISGALNIVQLSSLTANAYMVGQSITGTGIPSSTTILAVNTTTNQVTISANASIGTSLTLVLGVTIDLGALLPEQSQVN